MRVYLCSRVALDAHPINDKIATVLRAAGHRVFVPHEQHYNAIKSGTADAILDETIYKQDMAAMESASCCVVVGRVGVDCSFEIGWFQGQGVPIFFYRPDGLEYGRHAMWWEALKDASFKTIPEMMKAIKFKFGG